MVTELHGYCVHGMDGGIGGEHGDTDWQYGWICAGPSPWWTTGGCSLFFN